MGTHYSICCNDEKYNNDNNINYQINITQNINEIILKQSNLNDKNIIDSVKISARTKVSENDRFFEKSNDNRLPKLTEEKEIYSIVPALSNITKRSDFISEKLKNASIKVNFNEFKVNEKIFDFANKINFFSSESLQNFYNKQGSFLKDKDTLEHFNQYEWDYDDIKKNFFSFFEKEEVQLSNNPKLNFSVNENNFLSTTTNNANNNINFTYDVTPQNIDVSNNRNLSEILKTGVFSIEYFLTALDQLSDKNNINNAIIDKKIKSNTPNSLQLFPVYTDILKKDKIYYGEWSLNRDKLNRLVKKSKEGEIEKQIEIKNLNILFDFEGPGILIKQDAIFEGLFKHDFLNGPGRITTHVGDVFKGIFENGFLNKSGIFENSSGNRYEGEFKQTKMNGYGKEVFMDGSVFNGFYINNQKNGKGKFTWADGSLYEGDIVNNEIDGFGKFIWANGLKYVGEWKKGKMHGKGILDFNNGEFYDGFFNENKKQGKGKYFWSKTKYFEGFWNNNLQNGEGVLVKGNKKIKGFWKDGKLIKKL